MKQATHCYVGKMEGAPGAYAACVDGPEHPKDTAKFVRDIVKKGHVVERVLVEDARRMLGEFLEWREAQKQVKSEPDLFTST